MTRKEKKKKKRVTMQQFLHTNPKLLADFRISRKETALPSVRGVLTKVILSGFASLQNQQSKLCSSEDYLGEGCKQTCSQSVLLFNMLLMLRSVHVNQYSVNRSKYRLPLNCSVYMLSEYICILLIFFAVELQLLNY